MMEVSMLFPIVVMLHVQTSSGRSLQCNPVISLWPNLPKVGEKLIVAAKYCTEKEGIGIRWKMCGRSVGSCAKQSCSIASINNDPSALMSNLTIESANIANSCYFTFEAGNITLSKKIYVYRHPELISTNLNHTSEIHLLKNKPVVLQVNTSCMYPPPTINVYFEMDRYNSSPQLIERKVASDDDLQECDGQEVATSTSLKLTSTLIAKSVTAGTIKVGLQYGQYFNQSVETFALITDENIGEKLDFAEKLNYEVISVALAVGMLIWCCPLDQILNKVCKAFKLSGRKDEIMKCALDVIITVVINSICFSYIVKQEVTGYGIAIIIILATVIFIKSVSTILLFRRIFILTMDNRLKIKNGGKSDVDKK